MTHSGFVEHSQGSHTKRTVTIVGWMSIKEAVNENKFLFQVKVVQTVLVVAFCGVNASELVYATSIVYHIFDAI